jgi:hypothetical protein
MAARKIISTLPVEAYPLAFAISGALSFGLFYCLPRAAKQPDIVFDKSKPTPYMDFDTASQQSLKQAREEVASHRRMFQSKGYHYKKRMEEEAERRKNIFVPKTEQHPLMMNTTTTTTTMPSTNQEFANQAAMEVVAFAPLS